MIRRLQWHRVPSLPVLEALPRLAWRSPLAGRTAATETAALMVYVALIFLSQAPEWPTPGPQIADATYDELATATGLSRKLIAGGIERLLALDLVVATGSHQRRRYIIVSKAREPSRDAAGNAPATALPAPVANLGPPPNYAFLESALGFELPPPVLPVNDPFFKLPCRAVVHEDEILPFRNFTLRHKNELNALKLYLYLAAVRSNNKFESLAAHTTIHEKTGIPTRDIRKAISTCLNVGLLRSMDRNSEGSGASGFSHNVYYLTGCEDLPNRHDAAQAVAAQSAAADLF